MTHAECQNEDCGHSWKLQKAPGEYKGGVRCPTCGSTDVDIGGGSEGGRSEQTPARREQSGERRPAPQSGGSGGGTLMDAVIAATDDDLPTQQRAQAVKGGLGFVGDMWMRWQSYRDQKMEQQESRAANIELGDPEEVPYPKCECGYQFGPEDIGLEDDKARCPSCDRLYPLREAGGGGEVDV